MTTDRSSRTGIGGKPDVPEHPPACRRAHWRGDGSDTWRAGLLVGVSRAGLAIVIDHRETPPPGSRISLRLGKGEWPGPAEVVRVDHLSGTMDLVAAEFAS